MMWCLQFQKIKNNFSVVVSSTCTVVKRRVSVEEEDTKIIFQWMWVVTSFWRRVSGAILVWQVSQWCYKLHYVQYHHHPTNNKKKRKRMTDERNFFLLHHSCTCRVSIVFGITSCFMFHFVSCFVSLMMMMLSRAYTARPYSDSTLCISISR